MMSGFRFLFVVSFAASLLMVGVGMIVALLPMRVLNLSGSVQDVGYLASAFALSYLLVQMPVGYLADRLGAKPFLVCGYLLCCVSGMVFCFADTPWLFFLGRLIQGAGEAPIWALGPALLSLAYPHAKGRVIGIYNASIHLGLTLGPLLGILLAANAGGRLPFLLFAGLCFSAGLVVLRLLPKMPLPAMHIVGQMPKVKDVFRLLKAREPLVTLAGIVMFGAGYGICISVLPATLALAKDFDHVSTGVYFALFYVSISVAQVIIGPLSDKHGRHGYMIGGLVLTALGLGSFGAFAYPAVYMPLTVASIGLGVFCVSSMAYLNECVPRSLKATISAGYYLAWGLGYFLGPLALGVVGELISFEVGYLLLAATMLLQALVVFAGCRIAGTRRRQSVRN